MTWINLEGPEVTSAKKKKNFTESEIEVLLAEVEVRAGTLFESLSSSSSSRLLYCHCVHNEIPLVTTPRCIKNKNSINS